MVHLILQNVLASGFVFAQDVDYENGSGPFVQDRRNLLRQNKVYTYIKR